MEGNRKFKVHNLKIKPDYFNDVLREKKKFEVRYNDRGFKVGDILVLEEFDDKGYTGRYINVEITYIMDEPAYCKENFVILGFKLKLERGANIL
ncbi:MAG: DUF3850 domain-containing protein [Massilimicrobiota timonensis]